MRTPSAVRSLALLSTIFVVNSFASADTRLYSLSGGELHTCGISSVSPLGDINADGYPEILVGGNAYCTLNGLNNIAVVEAKHGKVLYRAFSDQTGDWEGRAVAAIGDVNGDMKPDILSGAPLYDIGATPDAGRLRVLSGADGSLLHTWSGASARSYFGGSVASLGPIAGKEHAIACTTNGIGGVGPSASYCNAYNLTDRTLVYSISGTTIDGLGAAVASIPDLTNDGVSEFVVSRSSYQNGEGRIELRRGQDGQILAALNGTVNARLGSRAWYLGRDISGAPLVGATSNAPYSANVYRVTSTGFSLVFSRNYAGPDVVSMAEVGDYSGDGQSDIAIGLPFVQGQSGMVEIVSKQGVFIRAVNGEGLARLFGYVVANLGDINGDGIVEAGFVSNEQAQGQSSLNVFNPTDRSSTINQCNQAPGDYFEIVGTVHPGGTVLLRGRAAGAPNSRVFLNFSLVNWYHSAPLYWAMEPNFPGCRTNLDSQTLTVGVGMPTDGAGNFQYSWSVPNVPSAIGMQFRVSALTGNSSGQLQLFNEIVFKVVL